LVNSEPALRRLVRDLSLLGRPEVVAQYQNDGDNDGGAYLHREPSDDSCGTH
jgi:hypothetical protein